jgi:hypothetical protein
MIVTWLESHLILLGVLAVLAGLGLGALWSRAQGSADSAPVMARRSSVPSDPAASSTTGPGSVRPGYQARSW